MFEIDNYWIIPYSLYLTAKYCAYINVEICTSIKSIKYIHKYIYKGSDCTTLQLMDSNKISQYLQGYYIGPFEAI